jgi:hypothetical protein
MLPQAEKRPEMRCAARWVRLRGQNQDCMLLCFFSGSVIGSISISSIIYYSYWFLLIPIDSPLVPIDSPIDSIGDIYILLPPALRTPK